MKQHLNKIYNYLVALLIVMVPFSRALPNIILPVIIVFFIIGYKDSRINALKKTPLLILYALMAYIFIKGAISQSLFTEFNFYNKLFIIMLLPILFTRVTNSLVIKLSLLLSIFATILVSFVLFGVYFAKFGMLPFNTGAEVNKLLVLERPYAGFYALAGVMLCLHLIPSLPRYKWALRAAAAVAVCFIICIAARLSLLSLAIISIVYLFFYSKIPVKGRIALLGAMACLLTVFIFFSGNLSKRFFVNESVATAIDYEPRFVIWNCAWHMLERPDYNYIVGFCNNNKVQDYYVQCFDQKISKPSKKEYYLETRFNSHNQFNDFMLVHGLPGFLLLVAFMGWLFIYVKKSFALAAIALGLTLFMLVENVLHRQMGCYIFSIFVAILLIPVNAGYDKD
ncbi:MAG: O-antigen ligase family protein [Bacteroidota bacterium]